MHSLSANLARATNIGGQRCSIRRPVSGPPQLSVLCGGLPHAHGSTEPRKTEQPKPTTDLLAQVGKWAVTTLTSASLLLAPVVQEPALADTLVVRLPASSNPEIFAAQRTLVEAWTIVGESYVDPTFNQHNWLDELREHMLAAYKADDSPDKAWEQINVMLSDLDDPYTRRIGQEDYRTFRVSTDGELQGIGLLIANELSSSGHLRVLAPIKGGPADRAGILPGDEVISINGQDTKGWTGEQAAHLLRGQGGTEVHVRLARRTDGIPGVASRPEPAPNTDGMSGQIVKKVALRREAVQLSPVFSTALKGPGGGAPVGYIRLSQFSGNAADDMRRAVEDLQGQGAGRYILDLRSNPGGLVRAGVDIASLWLDGEQPVFTVDARDEPRQVQTTEHAGPALTHAPLVVLVDQLSASASEIVSGALRDHGRAIIMGDAATYGKGRIQSVYELQDGSALFVTVAKYLTPAGSDIDKRGIKPDRACRLPAAPVRNPLIRAAYAPTSKPLVSGEVLGTPVLHGPAPAGSNQSSSITPGAGLPSLASNRSAPALKSTAKPGAAEDSGFVPGIPLDSGTEQVLMEALTHDRCVLAAERYLESLQAVQEQPGKPLTRAQTLYLALTANNRATM